jgi:serine/threonine-protein kinase
MEMVISRKYEVLGQLGQGGMGVVYKVRHVALDTILALKVLPRDLMVNPEMVTRFYHEARVMARLRHPNIIRVLDIDRDEALDFHYFVMEYIQGKTLRQQIQEQGPLPLSKVLTTAHQVARALAYAHAHTPPIIHRDIKPANIMIEDDSSRIVVMDFGLAKELGGSEMTQAGVVLGTLKYSPPEQLRREPLDGRADVYALGMVMYETYTGAHFFAGLDEAGVIGKLLYDSGENEPHFIAPTPTAFSTLVQKAIAKSRERRYQRVEDLLRAIEACSASLGDNDTVISPLPSREEAPPESSDIEDLDQQIRKLELERQRRLAATARAQAQDAREKATAAGAKSSTSDLLQQGSTKEELGHARMQSGNYSAALTVYQEAIAYFTKAREATATAPQSPQSTFSSLQTTAQEKGEISDSLWVDLPDANSPANTAQGQAKDDHWEFGEKIAASGPEGTAPSSSVKKRRISLFGLLGLVVLLVVGWVGYALLPSKLPPPSESPPPSPSSPPPALHLSQVTPQESSIKITEGESVSFAAQAIGAEPLLYRWTLEGKLI